MRIHCLQHVAFESPGTIMEWADENGHAVTYTYFFENAFSLPATSEYDVLLIMGGYMNVDEEERFPWLRNEKKFIKTAVDSGKKVIGICLGAQLIASVCGEPVYKAKEKEIGFFLVQFSPVAQNDPLFSHFSNNSTFFHWHGDTFDLPEGALLVASTPACRNQAFVIRQNILAIQFHPEMDERIIEQLMVQDAAELNEKGNYIQSATQIRNAYHLLAQNRKDLFRLLDNFLGG